MNERPKEMPLNPKYVICYSQGKVGSTSIMETLRTVGVPCHRCENHNIWQYHIKDYPTITPVREPISWIFSHIFEGFLPGNNFPSPDSAPQFVESIQTGLWNQVLSDYCDWWATHFRKVTGLHIYGNRWIKKTKWRIYSIRGLVVRTDAMDEVLGTALNEFLPVYYPDIDMSTLQVQHRAKGTQRFAGYDEFMDNVKFDMYWLANFYDKNKMTRYFFFAKEMREWIMKWAKIK